MIVVADGWRRCCRCRKFKPVGQFNAKTRWPNGWPRTRQAYCKPCGRQRNRELNGWSPRRPKPRRTREQERIVIRARARENLDKLRENDPEGWADFEARRRMDAKLYRDRKRGGPGRSYPLRRYHDGHRVPEHYTGPWQGESVPAAPLARYLRQTFPGWTAYEIAAVSHRAVSEHWLLGVLKGRQDQVEVDAADRLLTVGFGRADVFNALYPIEAS